MENGSKILRFFSGVIEKLSQLYNDNQMSLGDFQISFREILRHLYTAMLVAGQGGIKPQDIESRKFLQLGTVLQKQYRFLERFMRQVAEGKQSAAQITARSLLYVLSAKQVYWMGVADVRLPAYPGDGSSECLTHCACSWDISYRTNDKGEKTHLLATWKLGPTEHCPTCAERAVIWNPLEIAL